MKYSIIIPAYNMEQYIRDCVLSVWNQNYPKEKYEVIVVDDCSTDNQKFVLSELLEELRNKEEYVEGWLRIINHSKNIKQGGGRNTGVREAQGEYIFFLDADDYWCSKDVLTEFEKLTGAYEIIRAKSNVVIENSAPLSQIDKACVPILTMTGMQLLASRKFSKDFYCVWRACYKRDFLIENDIFFVENVFWEDSDWTILCLYHAKNILMVDFDFYAHRLNLKSTAGIMSIDKVIEIINADIRVENLLNTLPFPDDSLLMCYNRNREAVVMHILRTRNLLIRDAIAALRLLNDSGLTNFNKYRLSNSQKILFYWCRKSPLSLIYVIKFLTSAKRQIKSMRFSPHYT